MQAVQLGYPPARLTCMEVSALVAPEKREQFDCVFVTSAETGAQERLKPHCVLHRGG